MDRDRAKFVLESFRPNGSDAADHDFAEALHLATVDRELGEWLVRERAFDAGFAESLARVELPEGLRAKVLLAMVLGGSEFSKGEDELDKNLASAFARIEVPEGLRGRILEAMDRSAFAGKIVRNKKGAELWVKYGLPLAAAAGVALAFVRMGELTKDDSRTVSRKSEDHEKLNLHLVQKKFVEAYETSLIHLEERGDDKVRLVGHLRSKGLPCGGMKFPPGLESVKGLGCCELVVNGKRGSVICFDEKNGVVHLIIFRRSDIEGELPGVDMPNIEMEGKWAKASWANERYAYTLISNRVCGDPSRFF